MQNSIKIENAVLGETTFSGGISTTTDPRLGAEAGAGSQPQLFAPVVTGGMNSISWSNNTANGDFEVELSADVDGTEVTSPLTITEAMDGKTLTITASAENFESNSTSILLSYIHAPSFSSFNGYTGQETECGISLLTNIFDYQSSTAYLKALYNEIDYNRTQGSNRFNFPVQIGNQGIQLKIVATSSGTMNGFQCEIIDKPSRAEWSYGYPPETKDYCTAIKTVSCTLFKNGVEIYNGSGTNTNYTEYKTISNSFVSGDEFTFIVNVTY